MIQVLQRGTYELFQGHHDDRILCLDEHDMYIWRRQNKCDLLIRRANSHKSTYLIAAGKYRLYNVLTDNIIEKHLELVMGGGYWQGFIVLDGLPHKQNHSSLLIPTDRVYTRVVSV